MSMDLLSVGCTKKSNHNFIRQNLPAKQVIQVVNQNFKNFTKNLIYIILSPFFTI